MLKEIYQIAKDSIESKNDYSRINLKLNDDLCDVTKKMINDCNELCNVTFESKYGLSREKYIKKVLKYGDPYTYGPRERIGRYLLEKNNKEGDEE